MWSLREYKKLTFSQHSGSMQYINLYKLGETGMFSLPIDLALKLLVSRHPDSLFTNTSVGFPE